MQKRPPTAKVEDLAAAESGDGEVKVEDLAGATQTSSDDEELLATMDAEVQKRKRDQQRSQAVALAKGDAKLEEKLHSALMQVMTSSSHLIISSHIVTSSSHLIALCCYRCARRWPINSACSRTTS